MSALRAFSFSDLIVQRTRRRITTPRAFNRLLTELKLLRSTTTFRRQLKTFLFQSAYGHREDGWLFCDVPSVFSRGRNTNDSVTVTDWLPDVDDDKNNQQDDDHGNTDWSNNPHQVHSTRSRGYGHNVRCQRRQIHWKRFCVRAWCEFLINKHQRKHGTICQITRFVKNANYKISSKIIKHSVNFFPQRYVGFDD